MYLLIDRLTEQGVKLTINNDFFSMNFIMMSLIWDLSGVTYSKKN